MRQTDCFHWLNMYALKSLMSDYEVICVKKTTVYIPKLVQSLHTKLHYAYHRVKNLLVKGLYFSKNSINVNMVCARVCTCAYAHMHMVVRLGLGWYFSSAIYLLILAQDLSLVWRIHLVDEAAPEIIVYLSFQH